MCILKIVRIDCSNPPTLFDRSQPSHKATAGTAERTDIFKLRGDERFICKIRGEKMVKKLTKHGNSLAIVIDKPILKLLNIDEKTKIRIQTDGKRIILEPVNELKNQISAKPRLQKLYEELVEEHKETLKKLAG